MEYVDIVDEYNNLTGEIKEKQKAHDDGNFHRTAHIWIINNKNELNNYLIEHFRNDSYHGIKEARVIWDISVIAYMINKNWFKTVAINAPVINDDTSYTINNENHLITMVIDMDANSIYNNLFEKLGDINEN